MESLRGWSSPQMTCPALLLKIIPGLFPQSERERCLSVLVILALTTDELLEICCRIGDNKIGGLDGILNRALMLAAKLICLKQNLKKETCF